MTATAAPEPALIRPAAIPWRRVLCATLPAVLFLAVRAVSVAVYAGMCALSGRRFDLAAWDGKWYLAIAQHGYWAVDPALRDIHGPHLWYEPLAFFPAYPLAVRATAPLFAGSYLAAAVAVSTVAGVVAAYGVHRLAHRITGSARAAALAVVLFSAAPMAIVYSMAYPQALLAAAAAWALVGVVERRWVLAGLSAAVAGAVHPSGLPVIAVVMGAALLALRHTDRRGPQVAALLTAPLGAEAYTVWVALKTGSPLMYLRAQRDGWGTGWDWGGDTATWVAHTLTSESSAYPVLTAWACIGVIPLLAVAARRLPWQLWVYSAMAVVMALGSGGLEQSKVRMLLPAFPLLIVVAGWLDKRRGAALWLPVAGMVLLGLWFSAHSLTVWKYGI